MYEVTIYPVSYNLYVSYLWAGVFDLAAEGKIRVNISLLPRFDIQEKNGSYYFPKNNHIFYMMVKDTNSGKKRRVCIDLMDNEGIASLSGIRKSDIYFKRSYRSRFIQKQMAFPEYADKVRPFGLYFPVSSTHEKQHLLRAIMTELATRECFRHPKSAIRRVLKTWQKHSTKAGHKKDAQNWCDNCAEEFEMDPDTPCMQKILFLSRAFDHTIGWNAMNSEYVQNLNVQRVNIIRAFRRHFGDRFIGGFY